VSGFNFEVWASALPVLLIATTLTWLLSLPLRNVSVVDSLWSLMLFAAGVVYALHADPRSPRFAMVLWPLVIWAARLSLYITVRSMGKAEDRRYQAIRERNEPRFAFKSLYLVFWLQALLAWIISLPLLGVFSSIAPIGVLDYLGLALFVTGLPMPS
jgi:steroid 5-alpha reductase family enzyme